MHQRCNNHTSLTAIASLTSLTPIVPPPHPATIRISFPPPIHLPKHAHIPPNAIETRAFPHRNRLSITITPTPPSHTQSQLHIWDIRRDNTINPRQQYRDAQIMVCCTPPSPTEMLSSTGPSAGRGLTCLVAGCASRAPVAGCWWCARVVRETGLVSGGAGG